MENIGDKGSEGVATICCDGQTFSSIQAVLFDKDGTLASVEDYLTRLGAARWQSLCETEPLLNNAVGAEDDGVAPLLCAFGLVHGQLAPAGLLAVGSRYENEVAAAAFLATCGWDWIAALEAARLAFVEAEQSLAPKVKKTPLIAGAVRLIDRFKQAGVKVGIVSADLHVEVADFVAAYELSGVDWFCGAGLDRLPKTHPEFLQFACDEISGDVADEIAIAPQRVLVIGDAASDLLVAKRGAAGFVAMTGGWTTPPVIDFLGVDCAIAVITVLDQVEVFA